MPRKVWNTSTEEFGELCMCTHYRCVGAIPTSHILHPNFSLSSSLPSYLPPSPSPSLPLSLPPSLSPSPPSLSPSLLPSLRAKLPDTASSGMCKSGCHFSQADYGLSEENIEIMDFPILRSHNIGRVVDNRTLCTN